MFEWGYKTIYLLLVHFTLTHPSTSTVTRDSLGRSEMTHDWNATPVRYMLPALSWRGARMTDMINLVESGSPFFTIFPHGGTTTDMISRKEIRKHRNGWNMKY